MQKNLKYILFAFSGIFLLLLLLLLFTQTKLFRRIVRSEVLKVVNQQINGEVNLKALEGNFFTNLSFKGFSVTLGPQDTVLTFDNLSLEYTLLPLLSGNVNIKSVVLDHPRVNFIQQPDSTWNFQRLFPASADKPDTTPGRPMQLIFNLGLFKLNEGHINIVMTDSLMPGYVSNLNIELSGRYSSREMAVDLKHLGFITPPGIVDVKHLQFSINQAGSVWSLNDFALITPRNSIGVQGTYSGLDSLKADVGTSPLQADEFAWILPEFKLGVTPEINLKSNIEQDNLNLDLVIGYQKQRLELNGKVKEFSKILDDSLRHKAVLDLKLFFKNIDPQKWLLMSDLPLEINGNINISGNGLEGSPLPLRLEGDFSGSSWKQYLFRDFGIKGSYQDGAITVQSHFSSSVGAFDLNASGNLSHPKAPVKLSLIADGFHADRFLQDWGDSTILNMEVRVNGTGSSFESLTTCFSIVMSNSVAARVPVDSLVVGGRVNRKNIQIDTFLFQNKSLHLKAKGEYNSQGNIQSEFETRITDLNAFCSYVEVPVCWQSLTVDGYVRGRPDSLFLDVLLNADSLQYDTIAGISTTRFSGRGLLSSNGFDGKGTLKLANIAALGQNADTFTLEAIVKPDSLDARLGLWMPDSLSLKTHLLGTLSAPFRFHVPMLEISSPLDKFVVSGEGSHICIDSVRMKMDELHLRAENNKQFAINSGGVYLSGDSIDAKVSVANFDLSLLQRFVGPNVPLSGIASVNAETKGLLSKPEFDVQVRMESLNVRGLSVQTLHLDAENRSDTLRASLLMKSPSGDSIQVKGVLPVFFSLSDSQMVSTLKTVDGSLLAKNIRPASFFEFADSDRQSFEILLNMDVKARGEIVRPVLKGYVRIANGKVSFPTYGLEYTDLKLKVNLDSNRVIVDSLFARNEKGTLLVSGNMTFDTTLVSGNLSDADLSLTARDFFLSRHRNHEIQVSADTWVKINNNVPVYGGSFTVQRSSFYLPALLNMGRSSQVNKPLLVQALEDASVDSILLEEGDTLSVSRRDSVPKNDLMKKLTGRMKVSVPRNTWIKSEDMNLELYGDFDLLKNNEYFEIFGTLGISRGYYTLYGRKLIIEEGELTFQGGREINPRISLEAEYRFRGKDKQKNKLIMKASGTAFDPNFSFALNGNSITERDAMAYLIFNQSFDELSLSNQEGISGNMPSAMLAGLVSSQLTKTIGNTLNLDMVEVKAGDNWETATFMVGKYISNNLFVTYQRGFGENKEESLVPQTITLEYELTKNLFFRLTQGDVKDSGVDVILKFEKD
jgi:translocation and assembly module TamB